MRPEVQALTEALVTAGHDIVPFFRDVHLVHFYDVEPQLLTLVLRVPGPILGEGRESAVRAAFEVTPQLEEHFALIDVEEPRPEKTSRILEAWSRDQAARHDKRFTPETLDQALQLTHRFITRGHLPRKPLDLLGQVASLAPRGRTIPGGDVVERFCANHRVPRALVHPDMRLDLVELESSSGRRSWARARPSRPAQQIPRSREVTDGDARSGCVTPEAARVEPARAS